MEDALDSSCEAVRVLTAALDVFEAASEQYRTLEAYYSSHEWMEDYEADEAGLITSDLKRGVLSEDAVYDLITEYSSLIERMRSIITERRGSI